MQVTANEYKLMTVKSKIVVTAVARGWLMATTAYYIPEAQRKVGLGSKIQVQRLDHSQYDLDLFLAQQELDQVQPVYQYLIVVSDTLAAQLVMLYNTAEASNLLDKALPEVQFFRHIRNAISHGNEFHFMHTEPRLPAKFKSFEITKNLEGQTCLLGFVFPGDVLDLLDCIATIV